MSNNDNNVIMSFYIMKFVYYDWLFRIELYVCKVIWIFCFGGFLMIGFVNVKIFESYFYSIKLYEYFDLYNYIVLDVLKWFFF